MSLWSAWTTKKIPLKNRAGGLLKPSSFLLSGSVPVQETLSEWTNNSPFCLFSLSLLHEPVGI